MKDLLSTLGGLGLGAGLMYLLDPKKGHRRQAGARLQAARLRRSTEDFMDTASQDLRNRTAGLQAQLKARAANGPVDDVVLAERVRARLGRLVSHPRAVKVMTLQGRVTLSGDILSREVDDLLEAIARIPGVRQVEDHLMLHEHPGAVPSLQGGRIRHSRADWTPATRLAMGAAGGSLALYGLARRGMLGGLVGILGLGVSARAVVNTPIDRLVGTRRTRNGVDLAATLEIRAPRSAVYAFWLNYENFPRFMGHVREIRDLGQGRSHWVVVGPAGIPIGFDAATTRAVPDTEIAWKSIGGTSVAHSGHVRFVDTPDGTQVNVRMSYNPPAGAIGHAVATLFGANPEQEMEEDLRRLKTLLEVATATAGTAD